MRVVEISASLPKMNDIEDAKMAPLVVDSAESDSSSARQSGSRLASACLCFRRNLFVLLLLLSLLLSVGIGCFIKFATELTFTAKQLVYISFPGTLFLNMLKMVIVPLVVSSLVAGMSSLDKRLSGVLGLKALVYFFATTVVAVAIGIFMMLLIQPGNRQRTTVNNPAEITECVDTMDALLDLLRNLIPPNIVEACFRSYKTVQPHVVMTVDNQSNSTDIIKQAEETATVGTAPDPATAPESKREPVDQSNLLGLVVFSCALGVALGRTGPEGEPLRALANSLMEAILRLVRCIIWFSPVGIFFLILGKILAMDDWLTVFSQIGLYFATATSGMLIHGLVVLPLIFFVFTRRNPFTFIKGVSPALMTSFAASSSSATLALTINCLDRNGLDKRVTRFMLPIGSTISKNGAAIYEAVAAIFIAQVNDVHLDFATILTIGVTATLISASTVGIPQGAIVAAIIILNAVGLPAEDVTLIIVIDWFLDRLCTTVNVLSNCVGAGIVHYRSQALLAGQHDLEGQVNEEFVSSEPATKHVP